jgi:hypothetical protein
MSLIRKLIYVFVFIFSTTSFVVLFQNGWNFQTFPDDLQNQISEIRQWIQGGSDKKPAPPARP